MQLTLKENAGIDFNSDSYEIEFSVTNDTKAARKFCRYYTPFEGIQNNIFTIKKGWFGKAEYQGIIKKRAKPSDEDYITLLPGETKTGTVDLKKSYGFKRPGTYKIQYNGQGSSDFGESNVIKVRIE